MTPKPLRPPTPEEIEAGVGWGEEEELFPEEDAYNNYAEEVASACGPVIRVPEGNIAAQTTTSTGPGQVQPVSDGTEREWYCEADAVGITTTHCSPKNPIHSSPCGWMEEDSDVDDG